MRRQGLIFGLETTEILLVFLVPFVAFWTARLAMARGRNPWIWGGAALVLGIPWPDIGQPILGVAPVLFLMFFVRPTGQRSRPHHSACSKCASPHSPGQNFCTKCGWDLSREYSPDSSDTVLASEMHQGQAAATATLERPGEPTSTEPATPAPPAAGPSPVAERETAHIDGAATHADGEAAPVDAAGQEHGEDHPGPADEPAPEPARPWGLLQPGPAPTAEGMTTRGAMLLSEGKLQEAIDQFTKAIALNPQHREAFERRAEAYTQQGRGERAEEDYRRIEALNTGL